MQRFACLDFRAERNAAAHYPVGLRVGFRTVALLLIGGAYSCRGNIVARVGFADMCRIRAFPAFRIAVEFKFIIFHRISTKCADIHVLCQADRRPAGEAPDHACGEHIGGYAQGHGLSFNGCLELRHQLLKPTEHHVAAVLHPGQAAIGNLANRLDVRRVLLGVAEHELSWPVQVCPGQPLIGVRGVTTWIEKLFGWKEIADLTTDRGLRNAVQETEMFVAVLLAGTGVAVADVKRDPGAGTGRHVEVV